MESTFECFQEEKDLESALEVEGTNHLDGYTV